MTTVVITLLVTVVVLVSIELAWLGWMLFGTSDRSRRLASSNRGGNVTIVLAFTTAITCLVLNGFAKHTYAQYAKFTASMVGVALLVTFGLLVATAIKASQPAASNN